MPPSAVRRELTCAICCSVKRRGCSRALPEGVSVREELLVDVDAADGEDRPDVPARLPAALASGDAWQHI